MIAMRLGDIASVQLTHRLIVFRRANPGGGLTRRIPVNVATGRAAH